MSSNPSPISASSTPSLAFRATDALPPDILAGFRTLEGNSVVYMAAWRDPTTTRHVRTIIVRQLTTLPNAVASRVVAPLATHVREEGAHACFLGFVRMGESATSHGVCRVDDVPGFIWWAMQTAREHHAVSFELHFCCYACRCGDGTHPFPDAKHPGHALSVILTEMVEQPPSQIPAQTQATLQRHIHPQNAHEMARAMFQILPACPVKVLVMSASADGAFDQVSHILCHAIHDAAKYITVWCQSKFLIHRPSQGGTVPLCNIWTADGKTSLTPLLPLSMLAWSIEKVASQLEGEGVQVFFSYMDEHARPVYGKINLWRCLIE